MKTKAAIFGLSVFYTTTVLGWSLPLSTVIVAGLFLVHPHVEKFVEEQCK